MLEIVKKPCVVGNYRRGRIAVQGIVIHIAEGTEAGTDAWFNNPMSHVSAHYMVCKSGKVHQYVDEKDTAFHAGVVDRPQWELASKYHNSVNARTIGIEHEGVAAVDISDLMCQVSSELIAGIAKRHGFEISGRTIAGHHDVRFSKSCPGKVDVNRLIAMALEVDTIKPIT